MAEYYPINLNDKNAKAFDILNNLFDLSTITNSDLYGVEITVQSLDRRHEGIELYKFITDYEEHENFVVGVASALEMIPDYVDGLTEGNVCVKFIDTDERCYDRTTLSLDYFYYILSYYRNKYAKQTKPETPKQNNSTTRVETSTVTETHEVEIDEDE